VIRFQLVIAIVTALTAVVLKVVLVDGIGVSGAVWASSLAYLIFAAIPTFVLLRRGVAA
jgi:Na+-driven multidrug efflux pump